MNERLEFKSNGRIYLCRNGKQPQLIGIFVRGILTIKKNASDIFRNTNSVGLNAEMIDRAPFRILCVMLSSGEQLLTTKSYLLQKATHEKYEHFEEQLFMRIKDFGIEHALSWERKQRIRDISIFDIFPKYKTE